MRSGSSQLFAIVLLALLAGLSFWLKKAVEPPEVDRTGKLRHDPDAIAENFSVRQYGANGLVAQRLVAPFMVHYPDDDTSELKSPTLVRYRPDAPQVTITALDAKVTSKGETVFLRNDVHVVRAATADRPPMIARMPELTVRPDEGIAFTDTVVEVKEAASWVKGVGMHLDNNNATLVLKSQVTGLIYPRRVSK